MKRIALFVLTNLAIMIVLMLFLTVISAVFGVNFNIGGRTLDVGALAIFCTALGYVLYFRLIDSAGATNALLVTLLVPPVAILLGALLLGETLAPQDFAGLALIALGLAAIDGRLLSLFGRRRLRPAA